MTEEIAVYEADNAAMLEKVLVRGDFAELSSAERLSYINELCKAAHLNPLTRPFQFITMQGKLVLYAMRDCTDQIRKRDNVSITITAREKVGDDVYAVTAMATLATGRTEESIGAVSIAGLKGDALANAVMKAETKAKRRVTLSIGGLGMLDETEIEDIPETRPAPKALPKPTQEQPPEQEPFDLTPEAEERQGEMPTEERQQLMAQYNALYVKATAQGIKIQRVASNCPLSQLKGAIAFLEKKVG